MERRVHYERIMDRWNRVFANHKLSPPFHRKWCLPYNKIRLVINFLYFVIFLTTSQISFRFHALLGLSLLKPSCSLENQVGLNFETTKHLWMRMQTRLIRWLLIVHSISEPSLEILIKLVSYYSETRAAERIRGARPGKYFLGLGAHDIILILDPTRP